jgi:hypothetical protein
MWSFLEGKRGRSSDSSTVLKVNDTTKSDVAAGRSKTVAGIWRSKMTKENWVGGPNARLGQIVD